MRLFDYLTDVRWFAFSPDLAKVFTPTGAILLCWVIWKSKDDGGEVEATVEQIAEETGLTDNQIATAKDKLKTVLRVRSKRFEHKTFYSVDPENMQKCWDSRETRKVGFWKSIKSVSGKAESGVRTIEGKNVDIRTERKEERTSALPPPSIPVAQGGVKARRNGRNVPASPEARAIIQAFAEVYRARFRSAYVPDPKADVTAATFFLDAGVTAAQVSSTFEAATRSKGFWASKATTLPVLFRRWNEIQAELSGPAKAKSAALPGPQPDGRPETDGEAWAREVMEEQPQ